MSSPSVAWEPAAHDKDGKSSGRSARLLGVVAWAIAAVVPLLAVAYVALYLLILSYAFQPYGFPGAVILFCVPAAVFGALIVGRQPRNGVGWALLASSLLLAVTSVSQLYTIRALFVAPGSLPGAWLTAWFGSWMWAPGVAIVTNFIPLLFPASRVDGWPSRVLVTLSLLTTLVLTTVVAIFTFPGLGIPEVGPDGQLSGGHSIASLGLFFAGYAAVPLLALAALVLLGLRFRRSMGAERQQYKWFFYACALVVMGVAASAVANAFNGGTTNTGQDPLSRVSAAMLVLSLVGIPIATGIAILRYRLYDIDLVISRTIVYGSMALLITAVYIATVVGAGSLIHTAGRGDLLPSIIATAIVAVAFQPLRSRLQRLANRVVYGKQATPYEVLSTFSEGVAETYAEEEVLKRMARLVGDATAAVRAEVWIAVGQTLRRASAWPEAEVDTNPDPVVFTGARMPPFPGRTAIPVRHQGELLGALTVVKRQGEDLSPVEAKLLDDLARQAGLVLRTAGLTESLKARLLDLRQSRQRLVAAQDEERRRLERNLHDGAQQHLVALKVKLGLAKALAVKDPAKTAEVLDQLAADADDALETLRDLARGIYPPLLADKGLGAALEAQSRKATVAVTVDSDGVGRYSQDVEAAVYFCVLEALQNVQKYATASSVAVRLREDESILRFDVEDDGTGFDQATSTRGSGLTNMADRLDALGGSLEVNSMPGRGTRLSGTVALPRADDQVVAVASA